MTGGATSRAKFAHAAAGAFLSAAGLWFVFRRVDARTTLNTVTAMRSGPLLLTVVPLLAGTLLRAFRWNVLVGHRPVGPSFAALLVGSFFNGVLPFRSGDAVRALYFARRTQMSLVRVAAGAVLERVMDVGTLALLGAWVFSTTTVVAVPRLVLRPVALGAAAVFLAAVLGLGVAFARGRAGRAGPSRPGRFLGQVSDTVGRLASAGRTLSVTSLSLAMWLVTVAPFVLVLRAAGAASSPRDGLVILLVVTLAIALPATPGFVGTFHAGFVLGADTVGIPRDVSVPAAVVTHLLLQVPFILGGAAVLAIGGGRLLGSVAQNEGEERRS